MSKKSVVTIVNEILIPFLENTDISLVDVEFVKEGKYRYLRVFIDKQDSKVSLDDCQKVSNFLNVEIDKIDPIKEEYFLEVSSKGIFRPLKTKNDYLENIDKLVHIQLYSPQNGLKIFEGRLKKYLEDKIIVEVDNELVEVFIDKISLIKPVVDL